MLVEFKVGNYLSYNEVSTFSAVAYSPIKQHSGEDEESCNVFNTPYKELKLLKTVVLYGANNSGKSNLLSAMAFFKKFILTSSNEHQAVDEISVIPFLLASDTETAPSFFEMTFYIGEIRYRYGFEVDRSKVQAEWLFAINANSAKEKALFTREYQMIKLDKVFFKEGKGIEDKVRPNALFLSLSAQLNGAISTTIISWFTEKLNIISGLEDTTMSYTVSKFLNDENFKKIIVEFFKNINIGFEGIEIVEESDFLGNLKKVPAALVPEMEGVIDALKRLENKLRNGKTKEQKPVIINTLHKKLDLLGNFVEYVSLDFNLESKGTKKLFSLLGPIIDSIQHNRILIIDELDSRLHTLLTMALVKMFHHKKNKSAQLIFASHDTNLLRKDLFRRDQIWFTEKDTNGATDLYSLIEFKINQTTVRNDASFDKDYLAGKYGAIPFLNNVLQFEDEFIYQEQTAM